MNNESSDHFSYCDNCVTTEFLIYWIIQSAKDVTWTAKRSKDIFVYCFVERDQTWKLRAEQLPLDPRHESRKQILLSYSFIKCMLCLEVSLEIPLSATLNTFSKWRDYPLIEQRPTWKHSYRRVEVESESKTLEKKQATGFPDVKQFLCRFNFYVLEKTSTLRHPIDSRESRN